MPASRSFRFARTSRWATVASGTTSALATSGTVSPPTIRSVRATCASGASAGWQHVKISRRRSSGISSSIGSSGGNGGLQIRGQLGQPHLQRPLAADPVDGRVAGGGHDPAGRVAGHAVAPPAVERRRVGVRHRVLGQTEIAEDAGQIRHRAAELLAVQRGESGLGLGQLSNTLTGRTSIEPLRADGTRRAASIASSSDPASIR